MATSVPDGDWQVVEVIDGDTVVVERGGSTATVRLDGVNAPERDECGAEEAKRWLTSLEAQTVFLEVTGRDQFGRVLAHLHADGTHVNRELVSLGLGVATTPEEGHPDETAILAAEDDAFQHERGLWASGACGSGQQPAAIRIDRERSVPDPTGPDNEVLDAEIVVIVNVGQDPIDLSGWMLRDESSRHRFRFADDTLLAAGASIAIASDEPGWVPGMSPVWNNNGDLVLLQDAAGTTISRWRY